MHQMLFAAQQEFNELIACMNSDNPPEIDEIVMASGRIGHFLRLLEAEIINNRDVLLTDHILPRRYLVTSKKDIENEIPPPDGSIWL